MEKEIAEEIVKPKKSRIKFVLGFFKFVFGMLWKLIKWTFIIGLLLILVIGSLIIFNGIIYVELLIPFILILMFVFWKMWLSSSRKKLLKKYNPENDKGKQAEERRTIGDREPAIKDKVASSVRPSQLEGRSLFPTASLSAVGKNSKSPRGIFGRRRRRRK